MAKLFINVFFGLFALCGLAALLYSLWSGYMAHRAQSWPSTTGTVLKAYCYSTPGNTTWTRHVWYQYQVGGKTYSSGREHFGIRIGSRNCVAGYNKGQLVRIYYAPTDPGDAVLKPGATASAGIGIIFGLVFMGFSALGSWLSLRRKK